MAQSSTSSGNKHAVPFLPPSLCVSIKAVSILPPFFLPILLWPDINYTNSLVPCQFGAKPPQQLAGTQREQDNYFGTDGGSDEFHPQLHPLSPHLTLNELDGGGAKSTRTCDLLTHKKLERLGCLAVLCPVIMLGRDLEKNCNCSS